MKRTKKTKPKVKSSNRNNKANNKLEWTMIGKNVGTLRKVEKANYDEKEIK
jgi:hypothetical protein